MTGGHSVLPFRCAAASADRCEPLAGTASTVRSFLVVQQEGAWGADAVYDSELPDAVATWLEQMSRTTGVRPLLIRRHRRASTDDGVRVFAAHAHHHAPWMETAILDDVAQVTDLDLAALAQGRSVGLSPTSGSIFLTCTHGRHDVCCALRGRPAAAALATSDPELAWEVSHIGGDRFAGNMLVLPHGLYYGRVDAESAPAIAAAHLAGRLDLDHLRGRADFPFALQAAEHHLRAHLDLDGHDEVRFMSRSGEGDVVAATFTVPNETWRVAVRPVIGEPAQLTCSSAGDRRPRLHELVAIEQV